MAKKLLLTNPGHKFLARNIILGCANYYLLAPRPFYLQL